MTELEKAQEAVVAANQAVTAALRAQGDGWAEKAAEAFQARADAWTRLSYLMPVEWHQVYVRAVTNSATEDQISAREYREIAKEQRR